MKRLLFTLMLVLVAPASADDFSRDANYRFEFNLKKAVPMAREVNSAGFAPQLFAIRLDSTVADLEALGFECTVNPQSAKNVCRHGGYNLLPDYPTAAVDSHLTAYFDGYDENCPGNLSTIAYRENISEYNRIARKLSYLRYDEITAAIRKKYKKYQRAEARTLPVIGGKDYGYRLGAKIEVRRGTINNGYSVTVLYRSQCQVDKIVGKSGLLTELIEEKI